MSTKNKILQNKKNLKLPLVILFFLLLISIPVLVSYFNFYPSFIPKSSQAIIDSLVTSIPLIPKTPRQVLTKAWLKNQNLKNYHTKLIIKIDEQGKEILNFSMEGAIENALLKDSESRAKLSGKLIPPLGNDINLETQHLGNNFYFKPNKPFNIIDVDFSKFRNQWYKVNLKEFQESLGINARDDSQITEDIRNQLTIYKENFSKKSLRNSSLLKNHADHYEVDAKLSEGDIKDFSKMLNLQTKSATLRFFIEKKSFYLVRLLLNFPLEQSKKANLTIEYQIAKVGQNIEIKPLPSAEEIKSAHEFNQLSKGQRKDFALEQLLANSQDTGEVASNFLTLERLIRVFLLMPKAI